MKASFNRKLTSLIVAWAMLVAPIMPAYAQTATAAATTSTTAPLDFNTYCSPAVIAADPTASSDQTSAYCAQASIAQTAIKFQTMKEMLMMAAGATLTALGLIPFEAGEGACKPIAISSDAAGLGLDVTQSLKTSNISSAMMSGVSSLGSLAISMGAKNIVGKGADAIANHTALNTKQGVCLVDAGLAFAQGAVSMMEVSQQKKAEQSALQSVAAIVNSRAPGTSSFNLTGNTPVTSGSSGTAANAVAAAPTTATGTCAGTGSGSAYLSCLSKGDPVSAALTANPDAMNAMDQALGQPTGAFVQGYSGDGSPASVAGAIGAAMGMSPTGTAALQKAMDTAAQIASQDTYKPATYVANNAPAAATGAGDADFGKMMSGMMKKLAPDASQGEDPSTIVYRQLDLLPPSKIEANKDISIFARIGYRYRKASSELEQLNWANPVNQTVNNAPVGVSTTTPTTTAESNTRTPASKN